MLVQDIVFGRQCGFKILEQLLAQKDPIRIPEFNLAWLQGLKGHILGFELCHII